jgi:hypothetical protein
MMIIKHTPEITRSVFTEYSKAHHTQSAQVKYTKRQESDLHFINEHIQKQMVMSTDLK